MDIQESLEKILAQQETVAELFYRRFLGDYPEIRPYFQGVDLKRQSILLTMALMLVQRHYQRQYPTTGKYLKILGAQHQARRRIPREAYPKFRDCLLTTLGECLGEDWTEALALQWRHAVDLAAEGMLEGYEKPGAHLEREIVEEF